MEGNYYNPLIDVYSGAGAALLVFPCMRGKSFRLNYQAVNHRQTRRVGGSEKIKAGKDPMN